MPFKPFNSMMGRNALTLFDIRLDNDFIVFRGNENEASGQQLKGVVALCVPAPLKIEDIHLRLTGVQRLTWSDAKITPSGLNSSKVDRTNTILQHQWAPLWGTPGKSGVLEKGNYLFPFELMLPGNTCESVEGLGEASITYKLKATIARGKLAYDLHAYKHVRIVRTLEASALEFLHAMSVENIWPNKVEYSIVVPQKAVVFGSHIPLESRFTPLLKGLELGDITMRLIEIHEFTAVPASGSSAFSLCVREYKNERTVASWTVSVNRDEHWQDVIGDTGQEGWVVNTTLDLPRKLGKCVQDVNVHGIKVRHKLKMVVALKNPDGHVSELRATLPLTIFISPNIPLDEQGNLTTPASQRATAAEASIIAPPGYGEHVLDQLYDELEAHNLQTPAPMSAVHSPVYGLSRAGSSENLASMNASIPVHPAALTSRLQAMSARDATAMRRNRSASVLTPPGGAPSAAAAEGGGTTPFAPMHLPHYFSPRSAAPHHGAGAAAAAAADGGSTGRDAHFEAGVSRRNSGESRHSDDHSDPEHIDYVDMEELSKVPSYATAIKSRTVGDNSALPDYNTAAAQPSVSRSSSATSITGPAGPAAPSALTSEPLTQIAEAPQEPAVGDALGEEGAGEPVSRSGSNSGDDAAGLTMQRPPRSYHRARAVSHLSDHGSTSSGASTSGTSASGASAPPGSRLRHPLSGSVPFLHPRHGPTPGDTDERSWLHLLQSRGHVAT